MARNTSTATGAATIPRISVLPNHGATAVPRELNACVRFKRLEAVRGGPSTATYGFADVCRTVMPAARMINAVRNSGYEGALAAGMNKAAPAAMVHRPMTMAR